MAKILKCDFCKKEVEGFAQKVYLAPVLPGKSRVSFMSNYSHWAEACQPCGDVFKKKMKPRKKRKDNVVPAKAAKEAA